MNMFAPCYDFMKDVYLHRKLRERLPWKSACFMVKPGDFGRPILVLCVKERGYTLEGAPGIGLMDLNLFISGMIEKARSDNKWAGMEWGT